MEDYSMGRSTSWGGLRDVCGGGHVPLLGGRGPPAGMERIG